MSPMFAPEQAPSGRKPLVVGGVIALLLLASNVYLYLQLDRVRTDTAKLRESVLTELTNIRETSSLTLASNRKHMETLKEQLEATRRQASTMAGQAKSEALARAELLAKRLSDEQQRAQQRVNAQIGEVKEVATAANTKIADVSGDVTNVKTQVASTQSELQATIANLKKVTGELSDQGSYIATNSKELAALKRLGERNYIEFNLAKSKQPQRVGDITLLLKKADPKKNKFTIELMADDKRTEKRDRNVNEPVQFYVAKARLPYEIVVNEVKKDQIVGYLATPKDLVPRAAAQ